MVSLSLLGLVRRSGRTFCLCFSALLLALICLLLTPLTAAACGGMFSATTNYTEQRAEHIIFAVDPGQVTLYEQIHYSGQPTDFAWVLPVPAVPQVETVSSTYFFQTLQERTEPTFENRYTSNCTSFLSGDYGVAPSSAGAPAVNVYGSGTVGPYSYDIISSTDPQALTGWLGDHHYRIPEESRQEMQPYIAAHMLFLAMRLQGNAGTNDITPIKVTYATNSQQLSIPLRMATPMDGQRLGVLVWIFGQTRYVPQNYQDIQIDDAQVQGDDDYTLSEKYNLLINQAVDHAQGHGFVTQYAQPTGAFNPGDNPDLMALQQHYSYLTRFYTSIRPEQITLDPSFIPGQNQPDIGTHHVIPNSPLEGVCWPLVVTAGGALLVLALGTLLFVFIRRRRRTSPSRAKPE